MTAVELDSLSPEEAGPFDQLNGEVGSLLNEEDIAYAAAALAPNSTAALLVWENLWAASLADAVRGAGGLITAHDRIPGGVIQVALQVISAEEEPDS